jgi:hypothetical protein
MGPLRIGANGRSFADQEGKPFFWLGDTLWEQFRLYTEEDARTILEKRKAQGFTVIQIMLTGLGDGSQPNLFGEPPWLHHDPDTPNEAYFRHADAVIEIARKLDLILAIGVFHQLQRAVITVEKARAYARWVAERYRAAPHIIWSSYPEAKREFCPVLQELAAGLREGDGGRHLVTVHPDPSPTSSSFFPEQDWLDFHSIQTCVDYDLIVPMVTADYQRAPVKPVVMAEGGYEGLEFGKMQTAYEIRKQAYWTHLAGGHHTYGHNDHWTAPEKWRTWIEAPGAYQMGTYRKILESCPAWWDGVPDPAALASDPGEGMTRNLAMRSAHGDWLLVYLSVRAPVTVQMDRITAASTAEALWIDPATGVATSLGRFATTGTRSFAPPDDGQDALLLVRA